MSRLLPLVAAALTLTLLYMVSGASTGATNAALARTATPTASSPHQYLPVVIRAANSATALPATASLPPAPTATEPSPAPLSPTTNGPTATRTPSSTAPSATAGAGFPPVGVGTPTRTATSKPIVTNGQDLWNCTDFGTYADALVVYQANLPGDPNKLDQDQDGIPCEGLPGAPAPTPGAS